MPKNGDKKTQGEVLSMKDCKCVICGKEFESQRERKYCSKECSNKRPSKHSKHKPIQSITYTCKHCGKEYHPKARDRNTYCSRECAYEDKTKRCITCNKPITGSQSDYCSDECKQVKRICVRCGQEFNGHKLAVYCSDECMNKTASIKQYQYSKLKHDQNIKPRKCKECGNVFTPVYGLKKRTFCSDECKNRLLNREYKAIRKQQMKKAFIAPVWFKKIYVRDNGVCQICGEPVPYDKTPINPMGATIDHVIPLSKGGMHYPGNCQLAHRRCNSLKGNKIPVALGRVGGKAFFAVADQ
jgi:predicted nucleic acid-binding Zn ribbon protein